MKTIKILLLIIAISFISCKAQQLPLNTFLENIPQGAYIKDFNNELNPYVGIYKASFQGKEITLYISKVENKLEESVDKTYYLDALVIKYVIRGTNGQILQDTQNTNLQTNRISSFRIRSYDGTVLLGYEGTNCRVGWGTILLKHISTTQISWEYYPEDSLILPGKCPGNPDLTIYLPKSNNPIIFTKQ